jgi:hypothetical protein
MPWSYTFLTQIVLKDGRTISSLMQARAMMIELPVFRQTNSDWRYTAELVFEASRCGDEIALRDAHAQMLSALEAEGLL